VLKINLDCMLKIKSLVSAKDFFIGFVLRCLTWCLLVGGRLGSLCMLEALRAFMCT
jgi:hypothetical protein